MATTDFPLPAPTGDASEQGAASPQPQRTEPSSATISMSAVSAVEADDISASASAIATAKTGALDATGCVVGLAQVDGDAEISLSAVPIVSAKGGATFRQAYASAFISGGEVSVSQGGAPLIIGREVSIDTGGAAALVASDVAVRRGWIGLLFSRHSEVSEDSRVLLDTKGALILAAVLLGGFGLIAIALYFSAKRVSEWRPEWPAWIRR